MKTIEINYNSYLKQYIILASKVLNALVTKVSELKYLQKYINIYGLRRKFYWKTKLSALYYLKLCSNDYICTKYYRLCHYGQLKTT